MTPQQIKDGAPDGANYFNCDSGRYIMCDFLTGYFWEYVNNDWNEMKVTHEEHIKFKPL